MKTRTLPRELVLVGPAGSGKTYGVLDFLHCLARDNPRTRIMIARATRAALTQSVLVTYEQEILPLDNMQSLASKVSRRYRQSYFYHNGSEIAVCGLDDPNRVLSSTWDAVYINECIESMEDVWETLLSRMSRPGRPRRFSFLLGDTNPGDPSHWIRKRIDESRLLTEWTTPHESNPAMFDGVEWTDAGLAYIESLDRLTGTRRQRLRHGLWAAGEGAWFPGFDVGRDVTVDAEYRPENGPVHLAVDNNGLHTGAVWFQIRGSNEGMRVSVFADYYNDSGTMHAHEKAMEIVAISNARCGGKFDFGLCDPNSGARTGLNMTVMGEYRRAGLYLRSWPTHGGSVIAGLNLIESFLGNLIVHPRCQATVSALTNYRRAKRGGQWTDQPEDPQHPHEDLVDALRGGLLARFPEGRRPDPKPLRSINVNRLMY